MPVNGQYRDSESQDNTPILKVQDIPQRYWPAAMRVAETYLKDYPDRMGFGGFVRYTSVNETSNQPSMIVYRTKTSIVVRGNDK